MVKSVLQLAGMVTMKRGKNTTIWSTLIIDQRCYKEAESIRLKAKLLEMRAFEL
jgi:hypothetical protein